MCCSAGLSPYETDQRARETLSLQPECQKSTIKAPVRLLSVLLRGLTGLQTGRERDRGGVKGGEKGRGLQLHLIPERVVILTPSWVKNKSYFNLKMVRLHLDEFLKCLWFFLFLKVYLFLLSSSMLPFQYECLMFCQRPAARPSVSRLVLCPFDTFWKKKPQCKICPYWMSLWQSV